MGDHERVRQVISALVTNAYTYTPIHGWVKVVVHGLGSEIQVDVVDNGIGIAPQAKSRIFERFFRGEDPLVLASAGTGLGLAIAKTLVEMHNGRIWFESTGVTGEGSTFSFTLPVYEIQELG
jgi:signal transduction histidine kinase